MPHRGKKEELKAEYAKHVAEAEARAARLAKKEARPAGASTSGVQMKVRQEAERLPEGVVRRKRR